MRYTTLNIQGNLLSEEILQKVETAETVGQQAADFGFEPGTNIRSEIEYAWSRVKLDWRHFSEKSNKLPPSDPYGTSLTRKWMEQFLGSIGFYLIKEKTGLTGNNNQSYTISHTAANLDELPVHIVGFIEPNNPEKNTLDVKSSGGTSRLSPHSTMQEYLNVTEHVYGIATNGLFLRLIRDSDRIIKLTYLEFDLKRMLDEDKYSDFALLFRLLHASRFPKSMVEAGESLLGKYFTESIETGNRIREGLSSAVKKSLLALGNGFLQHEHNAELRDKVLSGQLTAKDYYRQLMRIIYRLLFLMVTEERDLLYDAEDKSDATLRHKKIYLQYYSIARLRKLSERRYVYESQFNDLWQGLVQTFQLFGASGQGRKLNIQPLAGDLFGSNTMADLEPCWISNKLLLECVRNMNEFHDEKNNLVSINYRSLDVEELGSVYEGLLELHPVINNKDAANPNHIVFTFMDGTDRKTTGSYYTRPELVNELIKSALIPVIEERLKSHSGNREAQAKALLKLKVCDAAAGSGHMLLAAARTIAWYLARVQSGEENPAPSVYRKCLREAIQHCIYAVDYNADAVELCKLALWLEGHNSGKPLSFLDHKIRNGNSLVGVTNLGVLQKPLPDEAFSPVTGDEKEVCKELKKRNATYRKNQQTDLFSAQGQQIINDTGALTDAFAEMERIEQNTAEAVQKLKNKFEKVRGSIYHEECACHIWTAAFFKTYIDIEDATNPSTEKLVQYFHAPTQYARLVSDAVRLAQEHKFFHWPLEFPDVFEQGGFDVMLGNPPWERIKLQQQEFFATRSAEIANAPNAAARNRLINALQQNNPVLFEEYEHAVHNADATGKFLRESGRYQLTAVGDINTYSVFSELISSLVNVHGRSGIIVPTGIATDDSNKDFFGAMVERNRLVSLFDFENREKIFKDVHSSFKFCLLTLSASAIGKQKARFGFFLTRVEHLQDDMRIFSLSKEDFLRLNPNTKTCPVFRTRVDAELTTKIYQRVPILINEETGENPWGVSFMRMFDMSNDSHLFRTRQQLEAEGFELWGNKMKKVEDIWLPLYEGKMFMPYDHRFANVIVTDNPLRPGQPEVIDNEEHKNPSMLPESRYFVSKSDKDAASASNYFIGFKNVSSVSNERTFLSTIIPDSAIGHSVPVIFTNQTKLKATLLFCNLNTLFFDYCVRQKLGGINVTFGYVNQFPLLPPEFTIEQELELIPKIVELVFTSWDIKAFADDVWREADADLKAAIKQQWEANRLATGGHTWAPPEWCEIDPEGCPLPPFKWDEERRAMLKAELDAIYAKLYGLTTEELRYILDPQDVYGPDFPGETFRVLKEKEIRQFGEYRTRRLVLEAWDRLKKD